jgi:hypothetical protein
MARYKVVDRSPRFLPVSLDAQLMVGSVEHALDVLIDQEDELSVLVGGIAMTRPAHRPTILPSRLRSCCWPTAKALSAAARRSGCAVTT